VQIRQDIVQIRGDIAQIHGTSLRFTGTSRRFTQTSVSSTRGMSHVVVIRAFNLLPTHLVTNFCLCVFGTLQHKTAKQCNGLPIFQTLSSSSLMPLHRASPISCTSPVST
jgi:hypothetical protein